MTGPSRRHQQRDSQATSVGRRGPESLHKRPAALTHTELGLPAPVLPPALPAHLSAVSGPLFARQRPVLPQFPARPAAAAAPGLVGPETGTRERPAAPAPQPAPPAMPGLSQGSAPTVRPRHRLGTVGLYPYPWNTSLFRRRSGEEAFVLGYRGYRMLSSHIPYKYIYTERRIYMYLRVCVCVSYIVYTSTCFVSYYF